MAKSLEKQPAALPESGMNDKRYSPLNIQDR